MPVQMLAGDCLRSLESSGAQTLTPASKISGPPIQIPSRVASWLNLSRMGFASTAARIDWG